MSRPITLFSGQWSDLPFRTLCEKVKEFGYDGIEIASFNADHMDIEQAADNPAYCEEKKAVLDSFGLKCFAISNHCAGQLVCDPNNDARSDGFVPASCRGNAEAKREWAVNQMMKTPKAARNMGVNVVTGFTGSPIWHLLYSYPPILPDTLDDGFRFFAKMFHPILDEFAKYGVKFALEVHPTEIAFDFYTAKRALEALDYRPEFGFNFDPSHLFWQGMNPAQFIDEFHDRIFHCHVKDAAIQLNGRSGILASHLDFGDSRRGWDFRSPGHGQVNFEDVIRALNRAGYAGPLSVEWEDCGMDREFGARDACAFARKLDFNPSRQQFDSVFSGN